MVSVALVDKMLICLSQPVKNNKCSENIMFCYLRKMQQGLDLGNCR